MLPDGLWRIARLGVVGLVLAAAVAGLVLGDARPWMVVDWSLAAYARLRVFDESGALNESGGFGAPTTVALLGAALVKAVFLWLILRTPVRGPLDRREKALRGLLYLTVAYTLVLRYLVYILPDAVGVAFQLALWTAIDILYLLVIRWRSRPLRVAAGAMFAVELAGLADALLYELDLPDLGTGIAIQLVMALGGVAVIVVTVAGQRRDGRWSRGTQALGWSAAGLQALMIPLDFLADGIFDRLTTLVMVQTVTLVTTGWIAATARELPPEGHPADLPPARRRAGRLTVAAVVLLPVLAMIHPEQTPHLTYTDGSTDCYDRPAFGDLKPAERDAVFLCLARSTDGGTPPMFPDSVPDQGILTYGRALCHAKDREKQEILKRSGWNADPEDLVYLCPEIVGASHPELLWSTAEREAADIAYLAEENATCRDPWPRTKGVVQATAKYFLFADGDFGYLVHDPGDRVTEEQAEEAMDRIHDDGALFGVAESAVLVGHVEDVIDLCLTVKALRTAPPRRTAGWEQINEMPIVSRSGRLTVPEMGEDEVGAGAPMPNLAIAGKGHYRLRVYVRFGDTGEEHLVVVFPGASKKRLTLKP
ncbi:hypothetical protein ACFY19_02315 [Streptosporangium saharense]|uniref:hypothetical protein n=1 Tax=Streptosporangium saharense TaxID=1706840 RepID=UPI0036A0470C